MGVLSGCLIFKYNLVDRSCCYKTKYVCLIGHLEFNFFPLLATCMRDCLVLLVVVGFFVRFFLRVISFIVCRLTLFAKSH